MALPNSKLEQIKKDATKESEGIGDDNRKDAYYHGYKDGSIAEAVMAERLAEALNKIASLPVNSADKSWAEIAQEMKHIANIAYWEWKGEKEVNNPCPHCGKELNRDRNLCCRECGKEVENGIR